MGVPAFFRYMSEKYPKIIAHLIEDRGATDLEAPLPQHETEGLEFDNLYIDMNGIIHPCAHPEDRPADMVPQWIEIKREMEIPVGTAGRTLKVIGAPLRLLSTFWGYDAATRTLFTSDAFGHNLMQTPTDSWVVDASNDTTSYEQVRDHLVGKFDWLASAHTEKLCVQLRELFATYEVETIAPQLGRIISGRETVARHCDLAIAALQEVGI